MGLTHKLYECGICNNLHRWNWEGDCREDTERFGDEYDYAKRNGIDVELVDVWSWGARLEADVEKIKTEKS